MDVTPQGLQVPVEKQGSASAAARALRAAVDDAVLSSDPAAQRLHYAETSVAFSVDDAEDETFTLLLDRSPTSLVEGGDAEVVVRLTPQQARELADGRMALPAAVLSGRVRYEGPVRKYLEVEPVLRRLLATRTGSSHASRAVGLAQPGRRPLDPALLAVETRGLRKSFGPNRVLQGLDITVPEGVISVVIGPSGTGKSVLLQHIIGLLQPDAGDVLIRGRSLNDMSRGEVMALRSKIGVMFQDGALFSSMTVYENVAFPLRQHTDLDEAEVCELVTSHLDGVGLASNANRRPNELSGGMRKRAGLARALVLNPGIVLCDEPDSGLDPVRTALLGDLLVEQHARCGGTMIIVTHNIALARQVSDHISVVWRGRVLESGMTQDVLASETPFVRQFLTGAAEGPLGMDA